jgi:hypothetical protein
VYEREPKLLETVEAEIRSLGYQVKYRKITLHIYDTIMDTYEKNRDLKIGIGTTNNLIKANGYAPKYVIENGKYVQRLIKDKAC